MRTRVSSVGRAFKGTILFVFMMTGALSAHAEALPTNAFIVRPAKAEITLKPGETQTLRFTLSNGTPAPLHVSADFEDVAAEAQGSAVDQPVKLLAGERGSYSLKDLLAIPKTSFDLLTGREVEVPVTISIPLGTEPGGLYGAVVWSFTPVLPSETAPSSVAVQSRIGSVIYVRVAGEAKEEGKLAQFGLFNNARTTLPPSSDKPLRFQVAYTNTGSVHLNPYGRITVKSLFGKETLVGIDPWAVLPGATRMREVDLVTPLFPGYYSAHLELNRGYKDVIDEADAHFWIIPTPEGTFLGLIVLLVLVLLIRRSLALSRNFVS